MKSIKTCRKCTRLGETGDAMKLAKHPFNIILYQENSLSLIVLIGLLAYVSYVFPVQMIGIQVCFSSLFLLMAGRLFSLGRTMLLVAAVHTAVWFTLDVKILTLVLATLEILLVYIMSKRIKRLDLMLTDLLFWLVLGIPALIVVYIDRFDRLDFGMELYLITLLLNQLVNALSAEICVTYIPFFRNHTHSPVIRLSRLLIHITVTSIIGSSFFFFLNTARLAERNLIQTTAAQSKDMSNSIRKTFDSWSTEQFREPIKYFRELVESLDIPVDEAELFDQNGNFIMEYSAFPERSDFTWMQPERWSHLAPNLFMWDNRGDWSGIPGSEWRVMDIIGEVDLGPYILYLRLSSERYVKDIITVYMDQSVYVVWTSFIIAGFAFILHRTIVNSITRLAGLSNKILIKVKDGKQQIPWFDSDIGEIQSLIMNFRHVTDQWILKLEESRQHAYYDMLTGLPNRRHFNEYAAAQTAQPDVNSALAVMFIDLDKFKHVNDTYGHDVGDGLLQQVAVRLRDVLGPDAFIARLGGDEFVSLISDMNQDGICRMAESVISILTAPFMVKGYELSIGGSLGISLYPEDCDQLDTVIKYADQAMYFSKGEGGGSYRLHSVDNGK
jgi:diguanylate cyclase